jgi:hypothetical protein
MSTLETKLLKAFESALLDIADEYQQNSPIGATRLLKSSWDVDVYPSNNVVHGVISNSAPNSKYRALGRDAGKFPPLEPLKDWVLAKGITTSPKQVDRVAYLIGRKISQEGTNRFKENQNPFYLNRDGTKKPPLNQLFLSKLQHYLSL